MKMNKRLKNLLKFLSIKLEFFILICIFAIIMRDYHHEIGRFIVLTYNLEYIQFFIKNICVLFFSLLFAVILFVIERDFFRNTFKLYAEDDINNMDGWIIFLVNWILVLILWRFLTIVT